MEEVVDNAKNVVHFAACCQMESSRKSARLTARAATIGEPGEEQLDPMQVCHELLFM